jgi:hypothetical protein
VAWKRQPGIAPSVELGAHLGERKEAESPCGIGGILASINPDGRQSTCRSPFSARSREGSVCRHEALQHRDNEFRWLNGLAGLPAKQFGVGDEVTMDCGGQLDGEFDWLVVGKDG